MATLAQRITSLATAIGTNIKSLITNQGSLPALTTTSKISLVSAINEVKSSIPLVSAFINDVTASGTTTYSSTKVQSQIDSAKQALKTEIFGGAVSSALDTLTEIEAKFGGNDTALNNLLTSVGFRVKFDAPQTLTALQITQVGTNIGVGEPDTDFVTTFNNALV